MSKTDTASEKRIDSASSDGAVVGKADASYRGPQTLKGNSQTGTDGVTVSFPSGSLGKDSTVAAGPAGSLAIPGITTGLGVSGGVSSSGSPIAISSNPAQNPVNPFVLSLPAPSGASLAGEELDKLRLVVLYEQIDAVTGQKKVGLLTSDQFEIVDGLIKVKVNRFGTYQTAYLADKVSGPVSRVGDIKTVGLPIIIEDQAEVCNFTTYIDSNGDTRTGTKDCGLEICTSDLQAGCLVTGNFKAAQKSQILAANIRGGETVLGTLGTAVGSAISTLCTTNGQQSCVADGSYYAGATCADGGSDCYLPAYAVSTQPLKSGNFDTLSSNLSKFSSTLTIAGTAGTLANCSSDGENGCISTAAYPAVDMAAAVPGNIKTAVVIAGQNGSVLPSPGNCSISGQQNCVATGTYYAGTTCALNDSGCYIPAYVSSTAPLKAIDYDDIYSKRADFRSSAIFGGVTGTLPNCTSNGSTGCVTTSTYLSVSFTNLSAGNIKSGVTIAGVTGDYPSSTYPLPGATAAADLTSATFNAQLKASSTFEWWDSAGVHYTGTGDTDLSTLGNIKTAVDIFGSTGTFTGPTPSSAWDLREGVTAGSVTGALKVNCRNGANLSKYDHNAPTAVDIWESIDDFYGLATSLPAAYTGWTDANSCGGVESSPGDSNVWQDVHGCASTGNCVFKDKISNLEWTDAAQVATTRSWPNALAYCDSLSYRGSADWRLPTQKELIDAYNHGIQSTAGRTNWIPASALKDTYWSATTSASTPSWGMRVTLGNGKTTAFSKTAFANVICVRP